MFTFYGCYPEVVPPTPADPTVRGTSSFRAVTHCEPFRAAAGFGWYAYPPIDFLVRWDGSAFTWMPSTSSRWLPLTHVPARTLRRVSGGGPVDDPILNFAFLGAATEPGVLQIWTGLIATSPPEWALLVRGIPNYPIETTTYEPLEGIIETGWYHGPLVGNLRFRRSDEVVQFGRHKPLFVMQPVHYESYHSSMTRNMDYVAATADTRREVGRFIADAFAVRDEDNPGGYRREVIKRRRTS